MKFIDYVSGAGPAQMGLADRPLPQPQPHQVLIKVAAFGVNRADTLQRQGKYPAPPGESDILGLEVAGTVIACGSEVKDWQQDDKVFGLVAGGGYAEYVAVNADHLMAVPGNIELTDAAGIAETFLTAYQSLFLLGKLAKGQKVLIHAGASGVGLAAIQLAKQAGCEVAVTASSAAKLARCAGYGADILINYRQEDFEQVLNSKGFSVDVVIDFVAGDYLNRNLKILNIDGRIVYLAMLAGRYADKLDMALLLGKRATIIGSTLRSRSDAYKAQLIASFSRTCLSSFAEGELLPVIDTCFAAADIGQAHSKLEDNASMGKLIGLW
jgi:NADPH2:quinone reductase